MTENVAYRREGGGRRREGGGREGGRGETEGGGEGGRGRKTKRVSNLLKVVLVSLEDFEQSVGRRKGSGIPHSHWRRRKTPYVHVGWV